MKMLIAVDFSPVGRETAGMGYALAKKNGFDTTFFHCVPGRENLLQGYDIKAFISAGLNEEYKNLKDAAARELDKVMEMVIAKHGVDGSITIDEHIASGNAGEEIIKYAKANGIGLIVMGYKSYSAIAGLLVGSTASKVVRFAPCSVLIYRPGSI